MTDPIEEVLLMAKRVEELAEGQSRFMNDLFTIVNDANARVRGLEQRVQWLEVALRGLMAGGIISDSRSARTDTSDPNRVIPFGNTRTPED